jgi:hypothetical protein
LEGDPTRQADLSNRRQIIPATDITSVRLSETAGRPQAWSNDSENRWRVGQANAAQRVVVGGESSDTTAVRGYGAAD